MVQSSLEIFHKIVQFVLAMFGDILIKSVKRIQLCTVLETINVCDVCSLEIAHKVFGVDKKAKGCHVTDISYLCRLEDRLMWRVVVMVTLLSLHLNYLSSWCWNDYATSVAAVLCCNLCFV